MFIWYVVIRQFLSFNLNKELKLQFRSVFTLHAYSDRFALKVRT